MHYYSTNQQSPRVSLKEAVLAGLAPDNGLYMPESIGKLPAKFWSDRNRSFKDTCFETARAFIAGDIPDQDLRGVVDEAMSFEAPLTRLREDLFVLELFHGPTFAFKDFGARFLSGLTRYFLQGSKRELRVLVATSGDTGSAVASAFFGHPNVKVILLYPAGKVSEIQEKQLTTMGGNITAVEVKGTFDNCQSLVKQAFLDADLKQSAFMTSANSINIARLLPQAFYYIHAALQFAGSKEPPIFSVPSGNFGNLTAGVIAKRMGAPIESFIAATNANKIVPEFLSSGMFKPRPSIATISNAMDVGNPSNFPRLCELCGQDAAAMRREITGASFSDEETRAGMKEVYENYRYTIDPHGAVAYCGVKALNPARPAVILATAHPSKFEDVVAPTLGKVPEMPERLKECLSRAKQTIMLHRPEFADFKKLLSALN